jgi:hypothetical protein
MGYKPYKVRVGRGRLKKKENEIIKILKKREALTAYEIWKENPTYTLRAYYIRSSRAWRLRDRLTAK